MSDPGETLFDDLVDGKPVDWAACESGAVPPKRLRALQAIERLMTPPAAPAAGVPAGGGDEPSGFRSVRALGTGAHGRVELVENSKLQRLEAHKILRSGGVWPELARRRFLSEARALAAIDHPNVVRIHDVVEAGDDCVLRLEFVEGRTLEEIVSDEGPLAPEEAARVGVQLCRALSAMHGHGLVHLDVKHRNLMRAKGGRIVLLDFGLARAPVTDGAARGSSEGTPIFMAPEQFGAREPGPAADLYAAGVLLYWLVSGRYPVEAESLVELHAKVLAGDSTPLSDRRPDVAPDFAAVVARAMALDPLERWPSAGALELALRDVLAASEPAPPARPLSRRWFLAPAALAAALLWTWSSRALGARPAFEASWFVRPAGSAPGDPFERLSAGDSVWVGDEVRLEVLPSDDAWVYVFNEDDAEQIRVLWPVATKSWRRTPAAEPDAVPGRYVDRRTGREELDCWTVRSAGGHERYFVWAAPAPIDAVEALVRSHVAADALPVINPVALLRGTWGLKGQAEGEAVGQPARPPGTSLEEAFLALGRDLRPLWRMFEFRNEGARAP